MIFFNVFLFFFGTALRQQCRLQGAFFGAGQESRQEVRRLLREKQKTAPPTEFLAVLPSILQDPLRIAPSSSSSSSFLPLSFCAWGKKDNFCSFFGGFWFRGDTVFLVCVCVCLRARACILKVFGWRHRRRSRHRQRT